MLHPLTSVVCGLKRRVQYPDFISFVNQYDVVCLAETKLDETDVVLLDGYTFVSQPRRQKYLRKSGSIGFFVRNNLSKNVKTITMQSEYIACINISRSYHKHDQDILIASVYIPPQQSRFFNNDEFDLFEQDVTSLCSTYDYLIMTADFNAQTGDLNDFTSADLFCLISFILTKKLLNFIAKKIPWKG